MDNCPSVVLCAPYEELIRLHIHKQKNKSRDDLM